MDNRGNIGKKLGRLQKVLIYMFFCFVSVQGLPSCSPKIIEKVVVQHDTTNVVRIDSVWQYQHDSVFVKEKGDTIYKYVEHIRYRDRFRVDTLLTIREFHDTTMVEKKVEKELTAGQKAKIGLFWWLIAGLVGCLVWIFRKPILTFIKTLI